ncbi:TetR/AcrR family transcriptional regulator C-terminal domain-containing protein [Streptomyces niveus]|uniref:TetR/AcrR family transcriptional regulator C-terminal domain-containing protein n=1 Tax=Streptomyces niveus TaxID=193462 RepID=UPI0036E19762
MSADQKPIASVWTRPRRTREQPSLSREQIVTEAVQLLDAEGVEALSMRKLGTRLGAGATSLYRHVASKDELIELLVDEVYGELELPDPADGDDWRDSVAAGARSLRAMVLRHPWVATMLGQVGLVHLGPNMMRMSERMLARFEAAGFPPDEVDQALSTLISYVIGTAASEAAYLAAIARSGMSEREWVAGLLPAVEEAARELPRLREGAVAQRDRDPAEIREDSFTYGLDRVLDGLETRINP